MSLKGIKENKRHNGRPTTRKGRAVWDEENRRQKDEEREIIFAEIEDDIKSRIFAGRASLHRKTDDEIAEAIRERTGRDNFTADNVREWRKRYSLSPKAKVYERPDKTGIQVNRNFLHRDTKTDPRLNPTDKIIDNLDMHIALHTELRDVHFDEGRYLILSYTQEKIDGKLRPFLLLARINDKDEIAYIQGAWLLPYLKNKMDRLVPLGYKTTEKDLKYLNIELDIIHESPYYVEYMYENIEEEKG